MDFTYEIEAVKVEVQQLRADGIKIILVLSHAGYEMDLRIAAEVEGIDVIVGGHSHTFLYTGKFCHLIPEFILVKSVIFYKTDM